MNYRNKLGNLSIHKRFKIIDAILNNPESSYDDIKLVSETRIVLSNGYIVHLPVFKKDYDGSNIYDNNGNQLQNEVKTYFDKLGEVIIFGVFNKALIDIPGFNKTLEVKDLVIYVEDIIAIYNTEPY